MKENLSAPSRSETGYFAVIEGSDACGKKTQFELLNQALEAEGYQVHCLDLPQYDKDSSYFVRRYLAGDYGGLQDVPAEVASLFFALERYDLKSQIERALKEGQIVLANRFTASNLAHQGAKLNPQDRDKFFRHLTHLEFETLAIPRPDVNFILHLSLATSLKLLLARQKLESRPADIHEQDLDYLKQSHQVYRDLVHLYPEEFVLISCEESGGLMSREAIHRLLRQALLERLACSPSG